MCCSLFPNVLLFNASSNKRRHQAVPVPGMDRRRAIRAVSLEHLIQRESMLQHGSMSILICPHSLTSMSSVSTYLIPSSARYYGHSGPVTSSFSADGTRLFTSGGSDVAVMQWRVSGGDGGDGGGGDESAPAIMTFESGLPDCCTCI